MVLINQMRPINSFPVQTIDPIRQSVGVQPAPAQPAPQAAPQINVPTPGAGAQLGSQGTVSKQFVPQSSNQLQNYLMSQNVHGAGNTNFQMNNGAQGVGPVAGFQGFQQNGNVPFQQLGAGPTFAGNALGGGNQFVQNGAYANNNGQVANASMNGQLGQAMGPGTSQVQSQGQQNPNNNNYGYLAPFQQPNQWLQPQNAGYGIAGTNPTFQPSMPGAYYSNQGNPNATGNAPPAGSPNGSSFQGPGQGYAYGSGGYPGYIQPPAYGNGITTTPSGTMSDVNAKTNINPAEEQIQDFLKNLGVYSYDYKDKKFGDKTYVSPMAQELEKSEIGKSMVVDTPEGKMVDYARGAGVQLAATAMLNHKVNELEKKFSNLLKEKVNARRK